MSRILFFFIIGSTCFFSVASSVTQSSFPGQGMRATSALLSAEPIRLKSTQQGVVESVYVSSGDVVRKGQVLVSFLNPSLYQEIRETTEFLQFLEKRSVAMHNELDHLRKFAPMQAEMAHVGFLEATFRLAEAEASGFPRNTSMLKAREVLTLQEAKEQFQDAKDTLKTSQDLFGKLDDLERAVVYLDRQIEDVRSRLDGLYVKSKKLQLRAPVSGILLECRPGPNRGVSLGDPLCTILPVSLFAESRSVRTLH